MIHFFFNVFILEIECLKYVFEHFSQVSQEASCMWQTYLLRISHPESYVVEAEELPSDRLKSHVTYEEKF